LIFQPTQDGKPAAPGLDSRLPSSDESGKLSCIKISSQIIFYHLLLLQQLNNRKTTVILLITKLM
jgi:hypothetical protein